MRGQYIRSTDRQLIGEGDMCLWLSRGHLKAETESEIIAAQDQGKQKHYKKFNKNITNRKIANADYVNYLMRQ